MKISHIKILLIIAQVFLTAIVYANENGGYAKPIDVGIASIDITPSGPILLAGYGDRKSESEGVLQRIHAKAIAFGTNIKDISVLVTVDLIGIQWYMTKQVAEAVAKKTGMSPSQFVICASHMHTGPEIGNLINHFGRQLPPEEIGRIDLYLLELASKLEQVALSAIANRKPSYLYWGQGKTDFAMNRRKLTDGKSSGMAATPEAPVDHSLPLLKVTDTDGNLTAVFVSYACHGTTLGGNINEIHGDWIGEAQRIIQERHPGVTAFVALGCGADANPEPRLKLEYTTMHGTKIADEVDRLLKTTLNPVLSTPRGKFKMIELPYHHVPTVEEFIEQTKERGSKGYFAKLALDKIARGEDIPQSLSYPVMTWTFGKDLAMVFLAGEVVVDYSLRLKQELGNRIWVNAYSNDVPCYIASKRVIREGGYEVEYSMYSYNRPSRFSEEVEDIIVKAVYELLPQEYLPGKKQ
ncbi:MAG: neutral/alkaline non-lysosomal ceramidase N-terminal domain-containing protein [Chitinophagaceae bacterium]|nr:neutral/alkaline non-lysosomal ceramidase N-terminal domain-containing protein [Chitinophagaceae bacterium]MCW5926449.1 neutral/alkaline non-lysosomal ceramidase N-terminal domain-containing protein [Chitinophagaceae bacterium]